MSNASLKAILYGIKTKLRIKKNKRMRFQRIMRIYSGVKIGKQVLYILVF